MGRDQAAAAEAVIEGGGTITHHHAVGRDHRPWYDRQRPAPFAAALRAAKAELDPAGDDESRRADRPVEAGPTALRRYPVATNLPWPGGIADAAPAAHDGNDHFGTADDPGPRQSPTPPPRSRWCRAARRCGRRSRRRGRRSGSRTSSSSPASSSPASSTNRTTILLATPRLHLLLRDLERRLLRQRPDGRRARPQTPEEAVPPARRRRALGGRGEDDRAAPSPPSRSPSPSRPSTGKSG